MKRALVVIQDHALRETVLDILHESGFVAVGASNRQLTVVLRRIREPVVTILDEVTAVALDAEGALDDHARIVLITGNDRVAQQSVNPYGRLRVHLPVPCNVDDFIRLTEMAYAHVYALDTAVAASG